MVLGQAIKQGSLTLIVHGKLLLAAGRAKRRQPLHDFNCTKILAGHTKTEK